MGAKSLLVPIILMIAMNGYAQTEDSLKTYDLKKVVVTGSRNPRLLSKTPEVMHVVTAHEIEELNVSSTGEILEYLTGVNIESGTGSGYPQRSIVSLDAFPANYTLVMVDGIRLLTEHMHTGQNIDIIPPENIERIEVIKGAASAQYGSDAMGGIVNIITKKAEHRVESSVGLSVSSYETYNSTISLRAPVNKNVSLSTFSSYEQSAGIPILAPAHRVGQMGYNKFSTMNHLNWDISARSSLSSNLYFAQNSMQFRGDNLHGRMLLSSIDYNHQLDEHLYGTARLKYSHWDAEQSTENNGYFNSEVYFNWEGIKNNITTFGVDYRSMNFERAAVLEKSQDGMGAFLQNEIELDRMSFLLALRFDKVDDLKTIIAPKTAVMLQVNEKLRLRASFGRGFHAPSLMELYEEGYGHSGRSYRFGNPGLQPEYSLTSTFSVEYLPVENLQFLVHSYYNTISDMITPIYGGIWEENPDSTTIIDKWVRTNIHEAEIYGLETTIRYFLDDHFLLEGGYNYAENQNRSTGGQLPYYPGESFFSKLIFRYNLTSWHHLSSFISWRATKNRSAWNWMPESSEDYENPDGLVTALKDYQLLNIGFKLTYRGKYSYFVNAGNLLAQDIQKLDDSFTEIDGEATWKVGFLINF
ncbi:MAG: TonB-dependent receptor [Candidatus Marinimicrobia bacterium]|nr:TonB-dependent receptor [Candidatus Neomarinimicrobiota bacterium]